MSTVGPPGGSRGQNRVSNNLFKLFAADFFVRPQRGSPGSKVDIVHLAFNAFLH